MRRCFTLMTLWLSAMVAAAQSPSGLYDPDVQHTLQRQEVLQGQPTLGSVWPVQRRQQAQLWAADTTEAEALNQWNSPEAYVKNQLWPYLGGPAASERPLLRHFYRNPVDWYHARGESFHIRVNPILYFQGGSDSELDATLYTNTRGAEVSGSLDGKVGFYTYLTTTQMIFPSWQQRGIQQNFVLPGEGFWKQFNQSGYDFFTPRGHINFRFIPSISAELGYGKHFIGEGQRSLILSDYSSNYLYVKLDTRFWRLRYTNLFAEMVALDPTNPGGNAGGSFANVDFPEKYLAMHHLSFDVTDRLSLGIFESVIIGEPDSLGGGFDLSYLNPVIFYRALEHQNGSAGNVLLGTDFRWDALGKFRFYGQFVLDEFLLDEVLAADGWWANKFAAQLGAKYFDAFGLSQLDLGLEANLARPYTYTHQDGYRNYTHFNQPLAHPLGANFRELVGTAVWWPWPSLRLQGQLIGATYGQDGPGENWGGNVLLDYGTRERQTPEEDDRGHFIGQGIKTQRLQALGLASWQWQPGLFLEGQVVLHQEDADQDELDFSTVYAAVSLRWNVPRRRIHF